MRLILAILLLQPLVSLSQIISTVNPLVGYPESWRGDTVLFQVNSSNEYLQLKAPSDEGEAIIFTPSNIFEEATWLMDFRMDFNPSSSNYMTIFLAMDGESESGNGFYLVLGTTADNVSLWQRFEGESKLLVNGYEGRLDASVAEGRVRVTRQKGGLWLLEVDMGLGWQTEGSVISPLGFEVSFFGLSCNYTSTRSDKFGVGPVSICGFPYLDTIPPKMESMAVINGTLLEFDSSEPLDPASLLISGLTFSPPGPVVERIEIDDLSRRIKVYLQSPLPVIDTGTVWINSWSDLAGNVLVDTSFLYSYLPPRIVDVSVVDYRTISVQFNQSIPSTWLDINFYSIPGLHEGIISVTLETENQIFLHLKDALPDAKEKSLEVEELFLPGGDTIPHGNYLLFYHEAARHDLVFSEIMSDPKPPALLPAVEYLELFNRSMLPVDLLGMELIIQDKSTVLPHFVLFPGEYVVLYSATDSEVAASFPNGVKVSGWPELPNSGARMVLRNPSGGVVTAMAYGGLLTGPSFKQEGGWSAEIKDSDNLSANADNWGFSEAKAGGTPGEVNSIVGVNPDQQSPFVADAWLEQDSILVLLFSEALQSNADETSRFSLEGNELSLDNIEQEMCFLRQFSFSFNGPLPAHRIFALHLSDQLTDLAGNIFGGPYSLDFGKPAVIDSFDIVINELLYDPPEGGCDYVELYNRSDHIADLSSLCLSRGTSAGEPEKLYVLSDRTRWFLPGWRLCFAEDTAWVGQSYHVVNAQYLRVCADMPNYTNEGRAVFLTLLNGEVVDGFTYTPEMHFALLASTKGVALERTMADGPSNDPMTWHSASGSAGYGTPTGVNSQHISEDIPSSPKLFSVSPDLFTPDQDGGDDLLSIAFRFPEPGNTGSVIIFDSMGHEVRQLINNRSFGTTGQITWDGTDETGQYCSPGIYIVWGRVFDLEGRVRVYKTTCVLGVRSQP